MYLLILSTSFKVLLLSMHLTLEDCTKKHAAFKAANKGRYELHCIKPARIYCKEGICWTQEMKTL